MPWHPIVKLNAKAVECWFPIPDRYRPFLADVSQRQIKELGQCVIAWKWAPVLGDFTQAHVHWFNRIGGVNDLANFRWVIKEWDNTLPVSPPGLDDWRIGISPLFFKSIHLTVPGIMGWSVPLPYGIAMCQRGWGQVLFRALGSLPDQLAAHISTRESGFYKGLRPAIHPIFSRKISSPSGRPVFPCIRNSDCVDSVRSISKKFRQLVTRSSIGATVTRGNPVTWRFFPQLKKITQYLMPAPFLLRS